MNSVEDGRAEPPVLVEKPSIGYFIPCDVGRDLGEGLGKDGVRSEDNFGEFGEVFDGVIERVETSWKPNCLFCHLRDIFLAQFSVSGLFGQAEGIHIV